jgi:hypothetical protein
MPQYGNDVSPPHPEPLQFLITLRDGQQVILFCTDPNPEIKHRNSMGAEWGLAFDRDPAPHVAGTIYEGEY